MAVVPHKAQLAIQEDPWIKNQKERLQMAHNYHLFDFEKDIIHDHKMKFESVVLAKTKVATAETALKDANEVLNSKRRALTEHSKIFNKVHRRCKARKDVDTNRECGRLSLLDVRRALSSRSAGMIEEVD